MRFNDNNSCTVFRVNCQYDAKALNDCQNFARSVYDARPLGWHGNWIWSANWRTVSIYELPAPQPSKYHTGCQVTLHHSELRDKEACAAIADKLFSVFEAGHPGLITVQVLAPRLFTPGCHLQFTTPANLKGNYKGPIVDGTLYTLRPWPPPG